MADKRGLLGMALVALRPSAEIPALQLLKQQLNPEDRSNPPESLSEVAVLTCCHYVVTFPRLVI
jgi:hypothetical protein